MPSHLFSSHHRSTPSLKAALLGVLLSQACTFDTSSLDDLTCEEEGQQDGSRTCRDGLWVLEDNLTDMRQGTQMDSGMVPPDMPGTPLLDMGRPPLDMPSPVDFGLPPSDMGNPPVDMATPPDMPSPQDMGNPSDMANPPDMLDPPDMIDPPDMVEPPEDMPDPMCPTTQQAYCEALRKDAPNDQLCFNLSSDRIIEGCTIPAGTQCDCPGNMDVCDIPMGSEQGTCMMACVPESDADYCARVQTADRNTTICGTGFQVPDNCGMARPSAVCNTCPAGETCLDDTSPSQCACVPLDPANDRTELCRLANQSCGSVQVNDGCGGRVTIDDCTVCQATQTCEPDGQGSNVCVDIPSNPVQPLPLPAGLASDAKFGTSVSSDGQWLAVGAPQDIVVNNQGNSVRCGAVYLYRLTNGAWNFSERIANTDANVCNGNNEEYGYDVAIVDGVLAIGSPGDGSAGRVHVYELQPDGSWSNVVITEPGTSNAQARFGHSVAVAKLQIGDDYRVAIGAPDSNLFSGGMQFNDSGFTYNLRRVGGGGGIQFFLNTLPYPNPAASARMGTDVAFLSAQVFGSGAPGYNIPITGGALFAWTLNTQGNWANLPGSPYTSGSTFGAMGALPIDEFGRSISYGNGWSIVGAPGRSSTTGSVFAADLFNQQFFGEIQPSSATPNDRFGSAVSASGDAFLAGAPGEDGDLSVSSDTGAVYLYEWNGSSWNERFMTRSTTQASGAESGSSVALTQSWGFFGAPEENDGQVYIIDRALIP